MSPPPVRRKLSELIQLQLLEPSLRNVVVEGPTDQALVSWFLERAGVKNVVVYPIEVFDIDADAVAAVGEANNNRGRVITIAAEAAASLPNTAPLACIIDRDLDDVLGAARTYPHLYRTDFVSMELYAFDHDVIDKFLRIHVRRLRYPAAKVIAALTPALIERFAVRVANAITRLDVSAIEWLTVTVLNGGDIAFDVRVFCNRCLAKSRKQAHAELFEEERRKARQAVPADARHFIDGHDFMELFAWFLRKHRGCGNRDENELKRDLYLAIEYSGLEVTPLFSSLSGALREQSDG
jgi:hypothetical protein